MKRGVTVLACVSALAVAGYFAMAKWGIQHESREFYDAARQRPINVDIAVRKDYEMKANAG
ncbi:MAG: alpha/beta hydrolase, partial [Bradyrhizobium sp.]|nr:alpha/beta hydrolase [Bradyrhizobium sp.]